MKKILAVLLVTVLPFAGLLGCQKDTGPVSDTSRNPQQTTAADTTQAPQPSEPNLRVVSFNVRMDLLPTSGMINGVSQNRIQAVREQILSYEPDLVGLQEDVQRWIDNINISTDKYTVYRPDEKMSASTMEYCSIYVKKGIAVKDSGWKWITATGKSDSVALTYRELSNGDGKYDMSAQQLAALGINNDASLKNAYTDKSDGKSYGSMLAARLMNWVVVEINGRDVIYVNTHLQHRGYDGKEYDEHPLFLLRYYERCAQFELIQAQIALLKQRYPTASVILTADFNDTSKSGFYKKVTEIYSDTMYVAKSGNRIENSWNAAYDHAKQGQGYVSPNENKISSRIDFCFISGDLADRVLKYRIGAAKWTLKQSEATLVSNVDVYPSDHLPVIVDFYIG